MGQISRVKSTPDQLLGLIEQPLVVPVIGCITDRIDGRKKLWSTTIFQESSITKFSNPIILVSTSREIMNSINIISATRDQDIKFSVSMSYLGVKRWFRTTARRPKITMHNDLCQVSKYYHHQPAPHQSQRSCSVVETRRKPQNLFVRAGRSCQSKRYPCWGFGSIQGLWTWSNLTLLYPERQQRKEGSCNVELEVITAMCHDTLKPCRAFAMMNMAGVGLNMRLSNQNTIIPPLLKMGKKASSNGYPYSAPPYTRTRNYSAPSTAVGGPPRERRPNRCTVDNNRRLYEPRSSPSSSAFSRAEAIFSPKKIQTKRKLDMEAKKMRFQDYQSKVEPEKAKHKMPEKDFIFIMLQPSWEKRIQRRT